MPAAATWKVFPALTFTGCPVHVPYRCRAGVVSQTSSPTRDQDPPEPFVHDTAPELDVAAARTVFQVITCPPGVYPLLDSSVMLTVAVGAVTPSRRLVDATVVYAEALRIAARRAVASS